MKTREFERKIGRLLNISGITYGKTAYSQKLILDQVFVHCAMGRCLMKLGKDCLEQMIAMVETENRSKT